MIVVSDSGPLISLMKAAKLDLLSCTGKYGYRRRSMPSLPAMRDMRRRRS